MLRTRSYTDANVPTSSEFHLSNQSISSSRYSERADSLIETENRIPVRDARAGFYTTARYGGQSCRLSLAARFRVAPVDDVTENPVDEARAGVSSVVLGDADGFVDGSARGYVLGE
jgi:hypothetical protein